MFYYIYVSMGVDFEVCVCGFGHKIGPKFIAEIYKLKNLINFVEVL